jgi:para-nitrobenzyl esterase
MASDHMYRGTAVRLAARKAAQRGAPAYAYLFTWRTPVLGGVLKSPHVIEIPFVFGTIDIGTPTTGSGADRAAVMDTMMATWLAFAKTGNPNNAALPIWPSYNLPERPTMVLNEAPHVRPNPDGADFDTLAHFADYRGGTPRLYAVD